MTNLTKSLFYLLQFLAIIVSQKCAILKTKTVKIQFLLSDYVEQSESGENYASQFILPILVLLTLATLIIVVEKYCR
jgi:hypothetical protein